MFKKFFLSFKLAILICWVVGFFVTGNIKLFFWSLAAGYGAGTVISEIFLKEDEDEDEFVGFRGIRGKPIKVFDLRDKENMPPELKETMDKLLEIMKKKGKLPESKKCTDPHCPACHGLADGDEKVI